MSQTNLKQVSGFKLVKLYSLHPNSQDVDSSSIRFQYFDNDTFDEYEREEERDGVVIKRNTFHDLGYKYEVVDGKADNKEPDVKVEEIEVDGVKFTVTKDDGGFSAEQVDGFIKGSAKSKKKLIEDLTEQIKLVNAQ